MRMYRLLTLAALSGLLLIASPTSPLFAQEGDEPDEPDAEADGSNLNPTGVSGIFNGNVTTGDETSSYDPWTRNFRYEVTDIEVPGTGTAGGYPLKFTRTYNSEDLHGWEMQALISGHLGNTMGLQWRHSYTATRGSWFNPNYAPGEGAGVVFPDGRVIPVGESLTDCPIYKPPIEESLDDSNNIWMMADGGKVHFGYDWGHYGAVGLSADRIIDPYGLETTIEHYASCSNCLLQNRIKRVTDEASGKYLEFTYEADPRESEGVALIKRIEAHDKNGALMGLSVEYHYISRTGSLYQYHPNDRFLSQVDYSDGTHAYYHWDLTHKKVFIVSVDDPHHAGPMRHIEYSRENRHTSGIWNQLDATPVSTINAAVGSLRTETRGDGATRAFTYTVNPFRCAPAENQPVTTVAGPFHGFLTDYTDFKGENTHIDYYADDDDSPSYRFIRKVTDANDHSTEYVRDYSDSWAIRKIIYHDSQGDSFIQQEFAPDPDPFVSHKYYLTSRTAPRKDGDTPYITTYERDPTTRRVTQINYPAPDASTPASSEEFLYDNDSTHGAYGQIIRHRLKNGKYVHFEYNARHLLEVKSNPTSTLSLQSADARTTYAYYGPGDHPEWTDRLKTETDPRGNPTTYEYDRAFDATGKTDPNGSAVAGRGLVTKIIHPGNKTQSFGYNIYGDKLWETNELNQTTKYDYDAYGRVTKVTDPDPLGYFETFDYTKPNTSSPLLHTTKSVFTHYSRRADLVTTNYDDNWRKIKTTIGDAITRFAYDKVGNQTKVTDPRGDDSMIEHTTVTTYDALNRVEMVQAPLNPPMVNHYDSRGRIERITRPDGTEETKTFDALNRVLTDTVPKDPNTSITTTFTYDPSGTVHTVKDGENHTTTFQYDASDMKTLMIYPAAAPGATPDTQTWGYDANHNLVSRKTAGGAVQTFAYDSRNRKIAMRWSNSVDFSDFDYDDAGRLNFAQNPYSTIVRQYDEAGRMTLDQQTMPGAAPTPVPLIDRPTVVSRKTHGGVGNFDIPLPLTGNPGIESRSGGTGGVYRIVASFVHPVSLLSATISSGIGNVTGTSVASFETFGTIITIDLANVSTAQKLTVMLAVRDGQVSDEIAIPMQVLVGDANANGSVREADRTMVQSAIAVPVTVSNFRCDVNATGVIDETDKSIVTANIGNASPQAPSGTTQEVHYEHDQDGRVTRIYIPNSYDYTQTYDGLGRLETIFTTGGAVEHQYIYDPASNVTQRIHYVNETETSIEYVPDALNRIASLKINVPEVEMPSGEPSTRNWFTREVYGYDPMNRLISVRRDEEPNKMDWFGYYLDGELQRAEYALPVSNPAPTPTPTPGASPTPTPTPSNQVATPVLSPPDGSNLHGGSQTITVTCSTTNALIRYTINGPTPTSTSGTGPVSSGATFFAGVPLNGHRTIRAIAYKSGMADSQITSATYENEDPNDAPGTPPRRSVVYNLDRAGNRTGQAGVTENGDPLSQEFEYVVNPLNQYTTAHGGSVGNGANHEISSYQGVSYTYLNDTHLAQAIYSDISGTHLYKLGYDALGRCVKRTTGENSVIYYIYDGERPIFEFDPTGGTPSINVYGRGIDEIIARSNNGDGQYPMQDHEGSVIVVTGGDGSIREWYRYDAFGAPTLIKDNKGNSFPVTQINNRFLFTGREYAPQFGFYEYRARAFHPGIGRFMSEDPSLFVRGMGLGKAPDDWSFEMHPAEAELNLYRYCTNNPWGFVDPMGLSPVAVDSDIDYEAASGAILALLTSERNWDSRGAGLERLAVVVCHSDGQVSLSEMSVGRETGGGRQSTTMPQHEGIGEAATHNHTNDTLTKGSILSPHDTDDTADAVGKPIYAAARDSKTGQIMVDRYRPSDSESNRSQHKDNARERLNSKAVKQLEKLDGIPRRLDEKWEAIRDKK